MIEAAIDRFALRDLLDPSSGEAERMVAVHSRARGMEPGRHSASLVFQRYSHRLCAVGTQAWFEHGWIPDLAGESAVMRFRSGSPEALEIAPGVDAPGAGGRTGPRATAEELVHVVVDRHLEPLAARLAATTGPGIPNLRGNMAAGFAGAFRALSRSHPADEVAAAAREVAATRPALDRGGSYRVLDGPLGARLQYDRRTCCHWYAAPDGRYCSWCSRVSDDERTASFRRIMADEAGG